MAELVARDELTDGFGQTGAADNAEEPTLEDRRRSGFFRAEQGPKHSDTGSPPAGDEVETVPDLGQVGSTVTQDTVECVLDLRAVADRAQLDENEWNPSYRKVVDHREQTRWGYQRPMHDHSGTEAVAGTNGGDLHRRPGESIHPVQDGRGTVREIGVSAPGEACPT